MLKLVLVLLAALFNQVRSQFPDVPTSKFIWFLKPGAIPDEISKTVRFTVSGLVNSGNPSLKYDAYFPKMQPGFTIGIRLAYVVKNRLSGDPGLYIDGFKFKIVLSPTDSIELNFAALCTKLNAAEVNKNMCRSLVSGDYVRYSMFVSVFLDPALPLPPNAGKRKVMYIVHMVGHYQKGDIAGSPIVTVTTDPPTYQQVTPLMETTDPAMIDLSQVAFEFSSTSPRSRIFVPNTGDTESPEIEILNFKMYPGVVLTAAQIVDSKFLMHLESYPLEPRVQSTFIDTRLVIVRDVAFDFASQIDRTVVGIRPQNEAFAGSFEHFPTSGRGSSSIYTRVATEVWERDATGFVTSMWFTAHQVSSDLDKVGLSRIRFILLNPFNTKTDLGLQIVFKGRKTPLSVNSTMGRYMYQAYVLSNKELNSGLPNMMEPVASTMKNFGPQEPVDAEGGGNTCFMFTKQWYFMKVGFRVDPVSLMIMADISIHSPSNPRLVLQFSNLGIQTDASQTLETNSKSGFSLTPFTLDRIDVFNMNISVSNLKIFSGSFGDFTNTTNMPPPLPIQQNTFSTNFLPNCFDGLNLMYLTVVSPAGATPSNTNFNVTVVRDCFICSIANQEPLNLDKGRLFPLLYSGGECTLKCSPWEKEDRKTGMCFPFRSQFAAYDFSPEAAKPDQNLCGDTFLQNRIGETCERFSTFFPNDNNDKCDLATCKLLNSEKLICQTDPFGKSSCEACSLDLCQKNRNIDFYFKACLGICGYVFNNNAFSVQGSNSGSGGANSNQGAIINGEKAYYVSNKTFTQVECEAANINLDDKLGDPNVAISACQACSRSNFFVYDSVVKLCLEAPTNPNRQWRTIVWFVTVKLIDGMSLVLNIMICVIAILTIFYLTSVSSVTVVLKFWEVMQIFYFMSFYIDNHYMSNYLFRQFTFVTGEVFGFKGYFMKMLLGLTLDSSGVVIANNNFRNLLTQNEFEEYKSLFRKFFQNGKIGLFLYDSAALIEIFIFSLLLILLFKLVLRMLKKPNYSKNPNSLKIRLRNRAKHLVPVFCLFFFIENLPILTFFCSGQIFMYISKIGSFWDPVVIINKVLTFGFTMFVLAMLPFYLVGIAAKVFRDDVWLKRIKELGYANTGGPMRTVFVLTIFRKILFALYFNPAVNTSGTTFYPFFIILIQIVELTQLFFAKVYLHRIVQWAHIFGSSVFVGLSFLLMMDKLMISISELSTGTTASSGFMSNLFYGREAVLLFGVVLTIMTYIVLIMGIVVQGLTGQLTRDKEVVSMDTKGQIDSDEDVRDSEKFVEQDFLDRRTMELAAL